MSFHLDFTPPVFSEKINYEQKLLFIGSCFAENIGNIMEQHKFNVLLNPSGIVYNPISIAELLNKVLNKSTIQEHELVYNNEVWNHFEFHSHFSNPDKEACLQHLHKSMEEAHLFLKQSKWLFITWGSAYVYRLNENKQIVSNCHKLPQKEFTKNLLEIEGIESVFDNCISNLKKFNPDLNIVLTVSPVRYIRDGIVENNRSKARLIEAAHRIEERHTNVFYFPAYELVIDDLRDYRFFKKDMVHPNEQAIEYIFEKFVKMAFDEGTEHLFEEIKNIINAKEHKPFNPSGEMHRKFKQNYFNKCEELEQKHPYLNLKIEKEAFTHTNSPH